MAKNMAKNWSKMEDFLIPNRIPKKKMATAIAKPPCLGASPGLFVATQPRDLAFAQHGESHGA